MSACEAMTVATVARTTIGEERLRGERKEQLVAGDRPAAEEIGALSHIVDQQGGVDDAVPARADRGGAEMAESAYIASPPVTTSIRAPRMKNES